MGPWGGLGLTVLVWFSPLRWQHSLPPTPSSLSAHM